MPGQSGGGGKVRTLAQDCAFRLTRLGVNRIQLPDETLSMQVQYGAGKGRAGLYRKQIPTLRSENCRNLSWPAMQPWGLTSACGG
jgi:hypothetical protein